MGNNYNAYQDPNGNIRDLETGDIICEIGTFTPATVAAQRRKHFDKVISAYKSEALKLRLKPTASTISEQQELTKSEKEFVWLYYSSGKPLFPDLNFQDICRLVHVATHIQYGTNKILSGDEPVMMRGLNRLVGINASVYGDWIRKMLAKRYIIEDRDCLRVNRDFISRGKLFCKNGASVTKVFIDSFQNAYHSINLSEHSSLGLIVSLAPFINPSYNSIATGQYDKLTTRLHPLDPQALATKLGYTASHGYRLLNKILSVDSCPNRNSIVAQVALDPSRPKTKFILINPEIMYAGDMSAHKEAVDLFVSAATAQ